ncbi:hypothetical protein [Streptomyces sp. TRM49041]|uniref:hypothetical protein n=1 Tax=Streptomyces sp. TRM49041 TaxID=2603216 RepID=UPI0011ED33EC|nr:hypothetical protein [Streptomyces sp. TRM49041]
MTSVVFVHGTGVREKAYRDSWERVRRGLARVRPDVRLIPCFWGEPLGARLGLEGASFPVRDRDRAAPGGDADGAADDGLALWAALDADPLAEIRTLAESAGPTAGGGFFPGRVDPWDALAARVRALSGEDLPQEGADTTRRLVEDLAGHLTAAAGTVADELSLRLSGTAGTGDAEALAARAVLALAVRRAEEATDADEPLPFDGADRDLLVGALTDRLGGKDRGALRSAASWAGARTLDPVWWTVSGGVGLVGRRRTTDAVVPAGGDILRYQARGEALRARIAETVALTREQDPGPVVLLAHSLGGIACVDLLALGPVPGVELLVTVGSQAPFLYEIDALAGLRRGDGLPGHFPRWTNLYDRRDLLGFVGERVFPGRVTDLRVDLRQPFPRSHTGYFAHAPLYDRLAAELP